MSALRRPGVFPRTSSMGRMFDAVAALCGMPGKVSFEGQAAMALEFAVDPTVQERYTLGIVEPEPLTDSAPDRQPAGSIQDDSPSDMAGVPGPRCETSARPIRIDWRGLLRDALVDRQRQAPVGAIAAKFHNALVDMAVAIARRVACSRVVLSGGCFQNRYLAETVYQRLSDDGFHVFLQQQVPAGDGGIALGQIHVAANLMKESTHVSRYSR
jgi:hydrogenase maturation protein HypF